MMVDDLMTARRNGLLGQMILHAATHHFGVSVVDLTGRSRARHVSEARQAVAYALRRSYPMLSLQSIGTLLGGRDHTTIIYALAAAERRAVVDQEYALRLSALLLDA